MFKRLQVLELLFVALVASACTQVSVAAEAPREDFPVAVVGRQTITVEREFIGEVHAVQRAEIRARVKGVIEAVAVDEAQDVTPGQVLFTMSARELDQELRRTRAAVATAAAELKAAELELGNSKALLDKGVVSPAEAAQARAKVAALAARLKEANAVQAGAAVNLTYTDIRAPFAGNINRIQRKAGSLVQEGDLLSTLTNASEVFVYFRTSEADYLDQMVGGQGAPKTVWLQLANGARYPLPGQTDAVDGEIDRGTGTIAMRARFANPQGLLKHGATGKVVVRSELVDAILVPQKATFEVQEHIYVYVVGTDGVAKLRRITPRTRHGDAFVLASGLEPGERYVLEGIQRVRDGAEIAVHVADSNPIKR
jgi:membrane fusion protein (multidrug efflux system)